MAETHIETGRYGESVAAQMLQDRGLEVLDRNWRDGRRGEIDIVARDPATNALAFVEVKTRSALGYGTPAAAVTGEKYARLRRLAAAWLAAHTVYSTEVRIDVVEVLLRRDAVPLVTYLRGV